MNVETFALLADMKVAVNMALDEKSKRDRQMSAPPPKSFAIR